MGQVTPSEEKKKVLWMVATASHSHPQSTAATVPAVLPDSWKHCEMKTQGSLQQLCDCS